MLQALSKIHQPNKTLTNEMLSTIPTKDSLAKAIFYPLDKILAEGTDLEKILFVAIDFMSSTPLLEQIFYNVYDSGQINKVIEYLENKTVYDIVYYTYEAFNSSDIEEVVTEPIDIETFIKIFNQQLHKFELTLTENVIERYHNQEKAKEDILDTQGILE